MRILTKLIVEFIHRFYTVNWNASDFQLVDVWYWCLISVFWSLSENNSVTILLIVNYWNTNFHVQSSFSTHYADISQVTQKELFWTTHNDVDTSLFFLKRFSLSLKRRNTVVNFASINPLKIKDVETYWKKVNEVELMFWNFCLVIRIKW